MKKRQPSKGFTHFLLWTTLRRQSTFTIRNSVLRQISSSRKMTRFLRSLAVITCGFFSNISLKIFIPSRTTPDTSGRDGTLSSWLPILTRCLLSISLVDWRSTNRSQTPMTVSERLNSRIMMGMCCVSENRYENFTVNI